MYHLDVCSRQITDLEMPMSLALPAKDNVDVVLMIPSTCGGGVITRCVLLHRQSNIPMHEYTNDD